MSSNIQEFVGDLNKISDITHRRVEDIKRYVALDLFNTIVLPPHPVRTGYARSNWNLAAGEPDTNVTDPPTKDSGVIGTPTPNDNAIAGASIEVPLFVTNSVHYIQFLENGTSRMAPTHFIARAVQVVEAKFADYVRAAEAKNPK